VYVNVVVVKKHIADLDVSVVLFFTSVGGFILLGAYRSQWVASGRWKHRSAPLLLTQSESLLRETNFEQIRVFKTGLSAFE
jgi:hypothetical protein